MTLTKKIALLSLFSLTPLALMAKEEATCNFPASRSPISGDMGLAFDFFRSLPDGSWGGNSGAYFSGNFATPISPLRYGIGLQFGASFGMYDWDGRGSTTTVNMGAPQIQGFVTGGFFRSTPSTSGINAGIALDMMLNSKFGVFALNPILGQIRAQFGYLISNGNELGVMATYGTPTDHFVTSQIPVDYRGVSQLNLFWSHTFKNCAKTAIWLGTPYRQGLMYTSGRAGDYIIGARFQAPLARALSVFGHGVYMGARGGTASFKSKNYAANVTFGLCYSFGGSKAGQRPYLPLADNSNFIVDTNLNE